MLKAILFDLDNTLLDFSGFKRESALAAAKAMKQAGINDSQENLYKKIFKIYESKGIEYQNTFEDLLLAYGLEPDLHEHAKQAAIIAYQKKKYALIKPRLGVIRTLNALKNHYYKLGIVTDAPRDKAWQRLILAGLNHYFDPVVTFTDTGEHKPSAKPFKRALSLLKLKPDEVLFVGDNYDRDIVGAKNAGLKTCLAKYGVRSFKNKVTLENMSIRRFEALVSLTDSPIMFRKWAWGIKE